MKCIFFLFFTFMLAVQGVKAQSDSTFIGEFEKVKVSFIEDSQGKHLQLFFKNEEDPAYGEYGRFNLYSKDDFDCFVNSSLKAIDLCEKETTETWYCGRIGIQIWSTRPSITFSKEVGNGLIALFLTKNELVKLIDGIKEEGKRLK